MHIYMSVRIDNMHVLLHIYIHICVCVCMMYIYMSVRVHNIQYACVFTYVHV